MVPGLKIEIKMASSSDPLADFEDGDDMDSFPPPGDEGKNLFQL